jgi:hypothetical protein
VGIYAAGEKALELRFSRAMDRRSTENAFTLSGTGRRRVEWDDDDRVLRLITEESLEAWTVYRWNIGEGALSREGAPLVKAAGGQFVTDLDDIFPQVVRVLPLTPGSGVISSLWGTWIPPADSLEAGLGPGQGIGIEFNKAMYGPGLLRSLSFSPAISGRIEQLSPFSMVFIPERDPEPGIIYTLTVPADTRDSGGMRMGKEYVQYFSADPPHLEILSIRTEGKAGGEFPLPENGASFPALVNMARGRVLRCTLYFSQPFSSVAAVESVYRLNLSPFFPGTLLPISLRSAEWLSDDRLCLEWEGLEPGAVDEAHYYELTLPGGRNGISTGNGAYFSGDITFYLKAESE